jgi:hypothetical protein
MAAHEQTRGSPRLRRARLLSSERFGAALSVRAGEGAACIGQTGVDQVHLALRAGEVRVRQRSVGFCAQLVERRVGQGAFEVDKVDRDRQEVVAWRRVGRQPRDAVMQRLFHRDLIGGPPAF